jgi:hypothetical protein
VIRHNDPGTKGWLMTVRVPEQADEADRIRSRLQALENERLLLQERLRQLEQPPPLLPPFNALAPTVTNGSSAADKIALFRRLFGGRTDVFPARWKNPKSGKSGYRPAASADVNSAPSGRFPSSSGSRADVPLGFRESSEPDAHR